MNKKCLIILLLSTFSAFGCGQAQKLKCFNQYLEEVKKDKEYEIVRQGLVDTLNAWIERGLYEVQYFKVNKPTWKVDDAVFFNRSKTKCLLLILIQDGDPQSNEDYVKIIGAEKNNEKWQYYYVSYACTIYFRETNNYQVRSFEDLSADMVCDLVNDGYVKCGIGCRINYEYIDGSDLWFADWMREKHQQFLNGTFSRNRFEEPHSRP